MPFLGLVLVLVGFLSYFMMLFVFQRFTYKTWIFDSIVGAGLAVEVLSWFQNGGSWIFWSAISLGMVWFILSRLELRLTGSEELVVKPGSDVPAMRFTMIDGTKISEQNLIDDAPTLLMFYRGWWCPSSKTQLNEIIQYYEELSRTGLKIYAASVDNPTDAAPLQEFVGQKITILCDVSETLLNNIGVRDQRGAPWYDRILFGAARQEISMPTALVINKNGKVIFAARSTRVDDRPAITDILASLERSK